MLRNCCRFCACHETKGVREGKAIPISKCLVRRLCNAAGRRKRKQRLFPQSRAMPSHDTPNTFAQQSQCVVLLLSIWLQTSCTAGKLFRSWAGRRAKVFRSVFTIHAVFPRRVSIRAGLKWSRGQPIKVGIAGCMSRNAMRLGRASHQSGRGGFAQSLRIAKMATWKK